MLPEAIAYPDVDSLLTALGIAVAMCALAFSAGWALARQFKTDSAQRTSLMIGLGMNNNGTGLVLASVALSGHPRVMLPIITYNLIQHLVAGAVAFLLRRDVHRTHIVAVSQSRRTPGTGSAET